MKLKKYAVIGNDKPEPSFTEKSFEMFLKAGFAYNKKHARWWICLECGKRSSPDRGYGCKHVEEWAWEATPLGGSSES